MASLEASEVLDKKSNEADKSKKLWFDNVHDEGPSHQYGSDSEFWFWAKQLVGFTDEKSVIFAGIENSKLIMIQLIDVVKTLKDIDFLNSVENINQLPQPNFIKVTFDAPAMVEIFIDSVSHIQGKLIKIVDKLSIPNFCTIAINNLPPDIIESSVLPQLSTWGQSVKITYQFIPKNDGGKVQIGQTKIYFKIYNGFSIQDIPYFIRVFGFKIFIHIQGRQRICFRCNSPNHLVSNCQMKYCAVCRGLRGIPHSCALSYAAVTARVENPIIPLMHDNLMEIANIDTEIDCDLQTVSSLSEDTASEDHLSFDNANNTGIEANNMEVTDKAGDNRTGAVVAVTKRMRTRSLSLKSERKAYISSSLAQSSNIKLKDKPCNKRKNKSSDKKSADSKGKIKKDKLEKSPSVSKSEFKAKHNKENPCQYPAKEVRDGSLQAEHVRDTVGVSATNKQIDVSTLVEDREGDKPKDVKQS